MIFYALWVFPEVSTVPEGWLYATPEHIRTVEDDHDEEGNPNGRSLITLDELDRNGRGNTSVVVHGTKEQIVKILTAVHSENLIYLPCPPDKADKPETT